MVKLLKLDFKRAIYNKQFLIVIAIGVLLSLMHVYTGTIQYLKYQGGASSYFNPFVKWISNDSFSMYSILIFFLFPALASLPYCESYWVDKNSGFNKSIYTRAKKRYYFISKYITNFIIGGVAVTIPLIFNLYLLMMILPSVNPSIFDTHGLAKDMFATLYYFHPYLYVGVYLAMTFVYGGIFASIGLAASAYCNNKFLVVATPVLIYISMYIFEIAGLPYLVPAKFLCAGQAVSSINILSIIIIFLILFVGSLLLYIKGVCKDECI